MRVVSGIEAYRVGLFQDIKRKRVREGMKFLRTMIKQGKWRSVRQYFNGYLAEWHYPPAGMNHYRCGHGWTKRRAIRRLGIHIAKSNVISQ